MSSFLDRLRARTRRANAKRAKRQLARGEVAPSPDVGALRLDGPQLDAIQSALADQSLEPVPGAPAYTAPEQSFPDDRLDLVVDGKATFAEVATMSPETVQALGELDTPTEPTEARDVTPPPVTVEIAANTVVIVDVPPVVERVEFAKSSNIRSATLHADGVVVVEFANGKSYHYGNFTLELLNEWRDAKSAGSWFHHQVKTKPDRHPVIEG